MSDSRPRLAQVEQLDGNGHVLRAFDVRAWPVRMGRALDNDIVLHDPHIASHHATLDVDADGEVLLTPGASRNGVFVFGTRGAQRVPSARTLEPLSRWRLGHTAFRVRRASDSIPAEAPIGSAGTRRSRLTLPLLAAGLLAWMAAELWIGNRPDATWDEYAPMLLALPLALVLWCGAWGLANKLFTGRFVLSPHLRVVCGYLLAMSVIEAGMTLAAYAFDLPLLSALRETAAVVLLAAMVAHHLRIVAPATARVTAAAVVALTAVGLAIMAALQWEKEDRLLDELYASALPPPVLRVAPALPPAALIDELKSLEEPLERRARELAKKDLDD